MKKEKIINPKESKLSSIYSVKSDKSNTHQFIKKISIEQTEDLIHLQFKIKGLWKENYKIKVKGNSLTISAICSTIKNGKRNFLSFSTSIVLPCNVKEEKIWSGLSSGILHIVIYKENNDKKLNFKIDNNKLNHINKAQLN